MSRQSENRPLIDHGYVNFEFRPPYRRAGQIPIRRFLLILFFALPLQKEETQKYHQSFLPLDMKDWAPRQSVDRFEARFHCILPDYRSESIKKRLLS